MDKVFIVILNWNLAGDTIGCLESLQNLSVIGYQLSVVVVDNGSSDDSVSKLKGLKLINADFKLLVNDANFGFAKGNNVGIRYAMSHDARYILVLNNDTIVDKDALRNLVYYVDKNSTVGVCSPKIYFAKGYEFYKAKYQTSQLGKVIWYAGGDVDWKNVYGTNHGVDEVDRGQFESISPTDFATGACSFIRAKALKEVGLYDEKYFMYLEDVDLSLRMKNKGWKVMFYPKAYVWHKVAQSSMIGSDLNDYFITRNRMLFGFKYTPVRTKAALVKESVKLLFYGRKWQKLGIRDFYLGRFGEGLWK